MEFACGFVYVPPSVTQKDEQRSNVKRSALLPPINRIRPRTTPPPPPTTSAEVKSPPPKIIEQLEKSKEVKKAAKVISFYENAEFHSRTDAVSSTWITPQQTAPPRKTALLPPHMRPAANSQSLPYSQPLNSPNPNSQTFIYDLPKSEPNLNGHPWDQDYSYTIPEGTGVQVKLPGEASSMSAQTSASADKGLLPGNPNVVLISLGKLLSQERVQAIDGQPVSCSQCGAVLDSSYCNMVKVCYFCQHCESASSTSMPQCFPSGYQDSLFLLNPDEQPLCAADALLLFCIDISGSMSITSQVSEGEHTIHRSRLQLVQEAVLLCVQRLSEQQPDKRVGLITFNQQVTMHGYENFKTQFLSGDVLTDIDYLKRAAASFPIPPPLSQTKDHLKRQVMGSEKNQ